MSFDWNGLYELANELRGCEACNLREARLRSSMSRAYYAVFCVARECLVNKTDFVACTGPEAHVQMEAAFRVHDGNISASLQRLRVLRNQADYDNEIPGLPEKCEVALKRADGTLEKLKNWFSSRR